MGKDENLNEKIYKKRQPTTSGLAQAGV